MYWEIRLLQKQDVLEQYHMPAGQVGQIGILWLACVTGSVELLPARGRVASNVDTVDIIGMFRW